jgi:hypothetical protein
LTVAETAPPARRSRRGRPLEVPEPVVLEQIQRLAAREEGLFRVHHTHSALYARARRMFGTWARAVEAAGLRYADALSEARRRSFGRRRGQRRRPAG